MIGWNITAEGTETNTLANLVSEKIWPNKGYNFGACNGIAVVKDDILIAGLIYHNYDEAAGVIEISGAAWRKGWLTRPVLNAMYAFPFDHLGCQATVQRVSDRDTAQHRMLKSFGAQHYKIPRLRGRDEAENIFIVTEETWRSNMLRQNACERYGNGR